MRLAILFVSLSLACSAPVPLVSPVATSINTDDGLLVLVPTVSANKADGQPSKRDVEYEVIAIPGEVLRREIRQITGLYNAPSPTPFGGSAALGQPGYVAPAPAPAFGGDAVLSTAGNILESTGNNLNSIGDATVQNAGNAIQFISEVSQGAGATLAESAGSGLQYAGQLSGALLRALLQVPAIKARLVTNLIQGSEPLVQAVSDVLRDSSEDIANHFQYKKKLIGEAVNIVIRLIQDTLALKGRVIAAIGGSGLDTGAGIVKAGVQIGGALIETGSNVVNAIGGGVKDVIDLGKTANLPAPPNFQKLNLPQLPALVLPHIELPQLNFPDLSFKNKNKQLPTFNIHNKKVPDIHLPPIHIPAPIHNPAPQHSTVYSSPSTQTFITPAQPQHHFIAPSSTHFEEYYI